MQSSAYFSEKVSASFGKLSESHEKTVITMKDFSAFLDMRRYKNWAHHLKTCPASLLPPFHAPPPAPPAASIECFISAFHSEPLSEGVEVNSWSST